MGTSRPAAVCLWSRRPGAPMQLPCSLEGCAGSRLDHGSHKDQPLKLFPILSRTTPLELLIPNEYFQIIEKGLATPQVLQNYEKSTTSANAHPKHRRLGGSGSAGTEHPNREVVSSRPCVRARSVIHVESGMKWGFVPLPFSLLGSGIFPFSLQNSSVGACLSKSEQI